MNPDPGPNMFWIWTVPGVAVRVRDLLTRTGVVFAHEYVPGGKKIVLPLGAALTAACTSELDPFVL